MQIKKTEIEEAIIAQAEQEFFTYGFEHASVRRIIRSAGTSIGNFYNYFENKEALFNALVSEEYNKFVSFITQHEQVEVSSLTKEILKQSDWRQQLPVILNGLLYNFISHYLPDFNIRFVLLVEGSGGTRYENTGEQLVSMAKEHLMQHGREIGRGLDDDNCELLARQFIYGLIDIIKQNLYDKQARNKLLTKYIIFYVTGVAGLLGMEK